MATCYLFLTWLLAVSKIEDPHLISSIEHDYIGAINQYVDSVIIKCLILDSIIVKHSSLHWYKRLGEPDRPGSPGTISFHQFIPMVCFRCCTSGLSVGTWLLKRENGDHFKTTRLGDDQLLDLSF